MPIGHLLSSKDFALGKKMIDKINTHRPNTDLTVMDKEEKKKMSIDIFEQQMHVKELKEELYETKKRFMQESKRIGKQRQSPMMRNILDNTLESVRSGRNKNYLQ